MEELRIVNTQEIERRSLAPSRWANLFMAFSGVTAGIMSNTSALMLDGLFSGVNFLAAIFAAGVAASIHRKPDIMRPFGYEINEPMYVMFRSLVLTGIIIVAMLGAVGKIVQYAAGEEIPPIQMGWIMGYVLLMLAVCFSLASWHHINWAKTGRESDLLKTERSAALIDGLLSAAAGVAFFGISLLKGSSLDFLIPVSDSIVVIGLSVVMIPNPIRMFFNAAGEVVGNSAEPAVIDRLKQAAQSVLAEKPYTFLDLAAVKTGRSVFAVAYIRPDTGPVVNDLDELRLGVQNSCEKVLPVVKTEIVYTGKKPFD